MFLKNAKVALLDAKVASLDAKVVSTCKLIVGLSGNFDRYLFKFGTSFKSDFNIDTYGTSYGLIE